MLSITMVYRDGPLLVCNRMIYTADNESFSDLASPLPSSRKLRSHQNITL